MWICAVPAIATRPAVTVRAAAPHSTAGPSTAAGSPGPGRPAAPANSGSAAVTSVATHAAVRGAGVSVASLAAVAGVAGTTPASSGPAPTVGPVAGEQQQDPRGTSVATRTTHTAGSTHATVTARAPRSTRRRAIRTGGSISTRAT